MGWGAPWRRRTPPESAILGQRDNAGRHQIETAAGFKSESAAGFLLECMAGFVGLRTTVLDFGERDRASL
jgi:hypothetical protein